MQMVNIHEAKTHLSRMLEGVERSEEVVIARSGQPIATLTAYRQVRRMIAPVDGLLSGLNPDNPLGRERVTRWFLRPFWPLGEVHIGIWTPSKGRNGSKKPVKPRVGPKCRLMDYLG